MRKDPVNVNVPELTEILENYLEADATINYAIKIVGHPGIGKSAVVRQTALSKNFLFIDIVERTVDFSFTGEPSDRGEHIMFNDTR